MIFLVTYERLPALTEDDQLLLAAIKDQGCPAVPVCWKDPSVSWHNADVAVVRSTWDYIFSPKGFRDWISLVSSQTSLVNSKPLLLWNIHKHYLLDLQNKGVSIIPTMMVVQHGNRRDALETATLKLGQQLVIKPAISCASHLTRAFVMSNIEDTAKAATHLDRILMHTDALIQPLITEVFGEGEQSLVFLNGEYSHTVSKKPFRKGMTPTHVNESRTSSSAEILFAQNVINTLPSLPTYARVDILVHDSHPLLNELELIEPELHLRLAPGSARKLASLLIEKTRTRVSKQSKNVYP